MSINYKLRITQKDSYFALEYEESIEKEWKESHLILIEIFREKLMELILK